MEKAYSENNGEKPEVASAERAATEKALKDALEAINAAQGILWAHDKSGDPDNPMAKMGQKAMELISDYPIYAATSNISYAEAIGVAMILFGDIDTAYAEAMEAKGL